jgi:hypothetical protein
MEILDSRFPRFHGDRFHGDENDKIEVLDSRFPRFHGDENDKIEGFSLIS